MGLYLFIAPVSALHARRLRARFVADERRASPRALGSAPWSSEVAYELAAISCRQLYGSLSCGLPGARGVALPALLRGAYSLLVSAGRARTGLCVARASCWRDPLAGRLLGIHVLGFVTL